MKELICINKRSVYHLHFKIVRYKLNLKFSRLRTSLRGYLVCIGFCWNLLLPTASQGFDFLNKSFKMSTVSSRYGASINYWPRHPLIHFTNLLITQSLNSLMTNFLFSTTIYYWISLPLFSLTLFVILSIIFRYISSTLSFRSMFSSAFS